MLIFCRAPLCIPQRSWREPCPAITGWLAAPVTPYKRHIVRIAFGLLPSVTYPLGAGPCRNLPEPARTGVLFSLASGPPQQDARRPQRVSDFVKEFRDTGVIEFSEIFPSEASIVTNAYFAAFA